MCKVHQHEHTLSTATVDACRVHLVSVDGRDSLEMLRTSVRDEDEDMFIQYKAYYSSINALVKISDRWVVVKC